MKSPTAVMPTPADNAAELVGRMRSGDASAWRDVVDQYQPLLRRLARDHLLSAEDADDAVQLTWLRCLGHIDQLAHPNGLRAWLITICRRESVRLATRRWREVPLDGPEMERLIDQQAEEADPFIEAVRRCEHDLLYSAIAALPQRQRALIVELLRQEGLSYLNLAHHFNIPVGSLGPTRQRALTRLRNDPRLTDLGNQRGASGTLARRPVSSRARSGRAKGLRTGVSPRRLAPPTASSQLAEVPAAH
jgi:RNA polymerase sigma factor (sigma-70 family)